MMPGKYPFNTYAEKIIPVPTTNVILKRISGQSGDHKLDDNLKEINLITKDAFEPNLPLQISYQIYSGLYYLINAASGGQHV